MMSSYLEHILHDSRAKKKIERRKKGIRLFVRL